MIRAVADHGPNLIFLDAALEGSDAVDALRRLALSAYKGRVQLISGRGPDLLEELRQLGEEYGLEMQTPLQKPFCAAQIMASLKLERHMSETSDAARFETAEVDRVAGKALQAPAVSNLDVCPPLSESIAGAGKA
jgi:CheY-like chemotaxis protein